MAQGIRTDLKYPEIVAYIKRKVYITTADVHKYLKTNHNVKLLPSRSRLITNLVKRGYLKRTKYESVPFIEFVKDYE